jgi:hypothetical protein
MTAEILTKAVIWRMMQWFFISIMLYGVALWPTFWPPQVQTGLLAAANCALGAWVAYWVDHAAFKKLDKWGDKDDTITACRVVAKGILIAGGMLACNLKLG